MFFGCYCVTVYIRSLSVNCHMETMVEKVEAKIDLVVITTRICTSLRSRMKFKTLCYPVFGRNKNTALPSF